MARILHFSDLHLSTAEREYCTAILDEIIATIQDQKIDLVLIAGDLFDTLDDAHEWLPLVREKFEPITVPIFYLPGNHELLRRKLGKNASALPELSTGNLTLLSETPLGQTSLTIEDQRIEIISVPHQENYDTFQESPPEKPEGAFRIVMAHAVVLELVRYTGPSEEEDGGVMGADFFQSLQADYCALGHIHRCEIQKIHQSLFAYPGSARIWRRGETGNRMLLLLDTNNPHQIQQIPIEQAGMYHELEVAVQFDGTIPFPFEDAPGRPGDRLFLRLSGIVENETTFEENKTLLRKEGEKLYRRFELDSSDVEFSSGLMENLLVQNFLERWEATYPDPHQVSVPAGFPGTREEWITKVRFRSRELALKAFRDEGGN